MSERHAELLVELEEFKALLQSKIAVLSDLIKRHEAGEVTGEDVQTVAREAHELNEVFGARLGELQALAGLTDEILEQHLSQRAVGEDLGRLLRADIEGAPTTWELEDLVLAGLENLMTLVPSDWLEAEAQKTYRLGPEFRSQPFHLVAGTVAGYQSDIPRPHYFAHMLLVARDFLDGHPNLDYWAAPTLLAEAAVLGNSFAELGACGTEALRKLRSLPSIESAEVPPTIYELLVAAAFARRGIPTEMIEAHPRTKSPDIRLLNQGIPMSVECKRRLSLTRYEIEEAGHVERLYEAGRALLQAGDVAHSIECTFRSEVGSVADTAFTDALQDLMATPEGTTLARDWGTLRRWTRPVFVDVRPISLYAPSYLEKVFAWRPLESAWDGLLCEVEPPEQLLVDNARAPISFKWASIGETAMTKKARGVTSLWASAVRQIPSGESGLVYIAYPEGARPRVADRRTEFIGKTAYGWFHRWHVTIPLTVINRLYARPLTDGRPDLIENSMRLVSPGFEDASLDYPLGVFVPER